MIEIKVDKASEFYWIKNVIDSGVMNLSNPYSLIYLGVKLNQKVTYKLSDNYADDIKEKVEEYNQETEEYLDPEEYEMMYGEDDPKGIK